MSDFGNSLRERRLLATSVPRISGPIAGRASQLDSPGNEQALGDSTHIRRSISGPSG